MAPTCMVHGGGGGFRGPPVPLILVPVVIHLVRSSCDARMAAYLREVGRGGPVAVAENAHRVVQYALSKLPANVLWWFTSKVLGLAPEVAMQTTEFLKSRTELDASLPEPPPPPPRGLLPHQHQYQIGGKPVQVPPALVPGDVERRLEMLERHYHALQERHESSLRLLADRSEAQDLLRELPPPDQPAQQQQQQIEPAGESMELITLAPEPEAAPQSPSGPTEGQALLQDVGLRLGKIILEWAGDTMKQRLVGAAASSSGGNQALVGAGVDLAERLVDAIGT